MVLNFYENEKHEESLRKFLTDIADSYQQLTYKEKAIDHKIIITRLALDEY